MFYGSAARQRRNFKINYSYPHEWHIDSESIKHAESEYEG